MRRRLLATLLALCTVLAMLPETALAATSLGGTALPAGTTFTINGKTVSKASGSTLGNCSTYASEVLKKIWTVSSTMTTFNGKYNMLKGKSAVERSMTAEHTKEFIQAAPLGSRIRVCADSGTTANNYDNNAKGHTMVLVAKDNAAGTFTVLHAGWGNSAATRYTYSGFSDYYSQTDGYGYFFYIANYSAADPSSTENEPGSAVSGHKGTFNGHTYQVFDVSLNWVDAKAACEKSGGHLVTITSAAEQTFVESLIKNGTKHHYWLGATDSVQEGTWRWITGETFSYTNWGQSQPDNYRGIENYLQMFKATDSTRKFGKWNDIAIDCQSIQTTESWFNMSLTGYICEWDNSGTSNPVIENAVTTRALNGHTYYLFDEGLSWEDAKARCESLGGYLACITSSAEQAVIAEMIQSGSKEWYWLGGSDADSESNWKWVSGEAWSYSKWGPGQPNNDGHENYLGIVRIRRAWAAPGDWNDYSGASQSYIGFICEIGATSANPKSYTLTFNANGGSVTPKTKTYPTNASLGTLPTPTRSGYKFDGWYTQLTGGTRVNAATKVTANRTLYAHWTKNATAASYTLTFDANGGMCTTKTKKVNANATYGTLPTPHRTGYTFSGWYSAKTGGTKVTSSTKATASRTLYAHWTKASLNRILKFDANGGEMLMEQKSVPYRSKYGPLPTPTRAGYHFTGWYTSKTGGTKITEKTVANHTGTRTVYARWSTAAVKATTTKNGTWQVVVPPFYNVMLYSSNVSAAPVSYIPEKSSGMQTLTCTRMATLSNGTTRYYTKASNGSYYWFTYTCEMEVN